MQGLGWGSGESKYLVLICSIGRTVEVWLGFRRVLVSRSNSLYSIEPHCRVGLGSGECVSRSYSLYRAAVHTAGVGVQKSVSISFLFVL